MCIYREREREIGEMIDMLCPSIPLMNTHVPALNLTPSPSWRHALCLCHHGLRPNLLPLHHRTPFLSPSTPTARTHIVRIGRYPMELDEDEEEQIYALEPSEELQGGTCHRTFFLELLSSIPEFEATIPDSGQDPPWCGDGDRFYVDNQIAIASALSRAHTAWNKLSGTPRRSWKGALVGIAFSIHNMSDHEMFAALVSKADFSLLFEALFHGFTVRKIVKMTTGSPYDWPDFYTMDLYPRDFRMRYFGPSM